MNAATLSRDPFMPQAPKVRGRAIALAVLAHVLLILALMFGVDWRSDEPTTVAAELWSATPQAAAPRAVEPPPTAPPPVPVRKVEPTPKPPEPVVAKPPAPTLPDPQIAIEKAKKEDAKRVAAEREEARQEKREKAEREKAELAKQELAQKKLDKLRAEQAKAEQAKAEQAKNEKAEKAETARLAAIRDQQLKRMQGMVGATGGATDTGTALRSSGPSEAYGGRIAARIKPNIVFTDPIDGNPRAEVELRLAPDGSIAGKRLVKSSGVKSWDDAVLRAIERTETFPLDNGRVPPPIVIGFRPRD